MFCDQCGNKIEENEAFCPNCGKKVVKSEFNKSEDISTNSNSIDTQEQMSSYSQNNNDLSDVKIPKKGLTKWIVLAVIIFSAFAFYNSDSGKYIIADIFANSGNYSTAYDILWNIDGERASVMQDYYKLMELADDFAKSEIRPYEGDNYDSTGEAVSPDEINEIVYGSNDEYFTMNDYYDLRDMAYNLADTTNFLSNEQRDNILRINSCLETINDNADFNMFTENLYRGYEIYDLCEYFKNGYEFNPVEKKEDIQNYYDSIKLANQLYYKYTLTDFYGYSDILSTINSASESMDKAIEKHGEVGTVYYTKYDYKSSPYINYNVLTHIADNLMLYMVKDNFEKEF